MNYKRDRAASRSSLALAAVAMSVAACGMSDSKAVDFAFTGRVLDVDTKQPIEGAYAIAVYEKVDLGGAGSARYCVRTRGMITDRDGKFSFPIDRLDGNSPVAVYAIKPNHYFFRAEKITTEVWKKNNLETYSNRNVYLRRQDPANLSFQYGYGECERPESREAADANIRFLEMERDELIRIGKDAPWFKNSLEILERKLQRLRTAN